MVRAEPPHLAQPASQGDKRGDACEAPHARATRKTQRQRRQRLGDPQADAPPGSNGRPTKHRPPTPLVTKLRWLTTAAPGYPGGAKILLGNNHSQEIHVGDLRSPKSRLRKLPRDAQRLRSLCICVSASPRRRRRSHSHAQSGDSPRLRAHRPPGRAARDERSTSEKHRWHRTGDFSGHPRTHWELVDLEGGGTTRHRCVAAPGDFGGHPRTHWEHGVHVDESTDDAAASPTGTGTSVGIPKHSGSLMNTAELVVAGRAASPSPPPKSSTKASSTWTSRLSRAASDPDGSRKDSSSVVLTPKHSGK